jgi:hypothetical protein
VQRSLVFLGELSDRPFGNWGDRSFSDPIVFTGIRFGFAGVGQL